NYVEQRREERDDVEPERHQKSSGQFVRMRRAGRSTCSIWAATNGTRISSSADVSRAAAWDVGRSRRRRTCRMACAPLSLTWATRPNNAASPPARAAAGSADAGARVDLTPGVSPDPPVTP